MNEAAEDLELGDLISSLDFDEVKMKVEEMDHVQIQPAMKWLIDKGYFLLGRECENNCVPYKV